MQTVPEPTATDLAYNKVSSATLNGGEKLTTTFVPDGHSGTFVLPTLAISKHVNSSYEVRLDGNTVFGPAAIPPTDIDDLGVTWLPALQFTTELKLIVKNLDSAAHTYHVQPVGWEVLA